MKREGTRGDASRRMSFDPKAPLYRQIADTLRQRVKSNFFADDRLPTEKDLSVEFGVSTITIKQALGVLVAEDLIFRRPR